MYDFNMIFADPKSFSREHTISLFSVFYFNLWIDYTQTHILTANVSQPISM